MPTENRSSNTEQMVSLPLDLVELALAHLPSDSAAGLELRELLVQPAAQHQDEQFTYSSKQATNCAGCGTRKHTPLRVDEMGGYVCLTCIDQKLESLLSSQEHQGDPVAWQVRMKTNLTEAEWRPWVGCTKEFYDEFDGRPEPNKFGIMREVRALYAHTDAGEVERMRRHKHEADVALSAATRLYKKHEVTITELRAQLAELPEKLIAAIDIEQERLSAEGYLMDSDDCIKVIRETLSASAEPAPTPDGFSAGDMADQGAKAFRDGQRAAIPEGFALVPKEMLLSKEVIGVINFHCGDTAEEEGGQFGQYTDGRLWVGNVTDDDGNQVHGLHIMTDEYPEEGSTTLIEFPAAPVNNPA